MAVLLADVDPGVKNARCIDLRTWPGRSADKTALALAEWLKIDLAAFTPATTKLTEVVAGDGMALLRSVKADPGSVSWGGGSAGGTDHILAGMIAGAVGVDPSKVNYIPCLLYTSPSPRD